MPFNELNSVEHFIVHQLSGTNLNSGEVHEPDESATPEWRFVAAAELDRQLNEVLLVDEVKEALVRLNPEIAAQPELAEEVIYKLRAIILGVRTDGLVKANEEFHRWLVGDRTMPFGEHNRHVPVRLIDFEDLSSNKYVVTNQFRVRKQETKIPDVVLFINGLPVVVGEAKTPIRSSISWLDGATEIHEVYENTVMELFVPNILSFATEGKQLYYGGVRCPLEHWAPWRMENDPDAIARQIGLGEVGKELSDLLKPKRLLDILRNFSLFSSSKGGRRIKIIPRFQQYEGVNKIVERVKEGRLKKGLIWHFQGSGKSFLMVFAAQKLRRDPELKSPTVMVLVDRTDLDTQITGIFDAADVSNVVSTEKIEEVQKLLERDTRKIIVSMIHKFRDAPANLNERENIVVLVDEAHRTQEGDLGRAMRAALPNAFLFGLTGTPINKADKNTFWAFGSDEDEGGYMSRYTFHDSIRDEATLPLHFEPRLVDIRLDKAAIDSAMDAFKEASDLTEEEADKLNKKSARMAAFLKSPERVEKVVADIANHFKEKVEPHGFKAMIVTTDRFACAQYKTELDRHFQETASAVVMSTTANDELEFKQKYDLSGGKQEKLLETFNDARSDLRFLIVTAKLLTGFDAPILQTMYLDKSLKDHTLLQAICRTNRKYPGKTYGRIVDYYGVFDDAAKALQFDEKSVQQVISNLSVLREELPMAMRAAIAHFEGVSRTSGGFEELEAAQEKIKTNESKDAFARDYKRLSKLWESLSPDRLLDVFNQDYRWLTAVFESVRPPVDTIGRLLWHAHGPMTLKIMHEHTHVGQVHDLNEFVLDADVIEDIFNNPDPRNAKRLEKMLVKRFQKHQGDPEFKKLSERLDALRERAEAGLITSIEFVKELCKIARDTVAVEKAKDAASAEKTPKAALTELFQSIKTEDTPVVVERIVEDIDAIVRVVRFDGWQQSQAGEREVQSELRKILWIKYKLRDQALFDKAYAYVKEYY